MPRQKRIEVAAFLAALVCAVTFPHTAGAETGHALRVLDSAGWARA